jgi:hypothetical protein
MDCDGGSVVEPRVQTTRAASNPCERFKPAVEDAILRGYVNSFVDFDHHPNDNNLCWSLSHPAASVRSKQPRQRSLPGTLENLSSGRWHRPTERPLPANLASGSAIYWSCSSDFPKTYRSIDLPQDVTTINIPLQAAMSLEFRMFSRRDRARSFMNSDLCSCYAVRFDVNQNRTEGSTLACFYS